MQSPLRRLFVYSSVILSLGLILGACQLMPVPTGNPHPTGVDVLPAFNTKAHTAGEPEMVTFPSQVTTQRLTAIEQLATGKHFALRFSTMSNEDPAHPQHIQVPVSGAYKLKVLPGSAFAIDDADGTDGAASVTLPQATYNAYLKLNGSRSVDQVRSLKVQDNLYYLKDELVRTKKGPGGFTVLANKDPKLAKLQITAMCSNDPNDYRVWKITNPNSIDVAYRWSIEQTAQSDVGTAPPGDSYLETDTEGGKNTLKLFVGDKQQDSQVSKPDVCLPGQEADREESKWWSLGVRSLPVPNDWHSDNGANQVFNLTNQGVTDFVMRWVKTPGQQISLPPGIKEIGPDGGTIDLPGVAELVFPQGALTKQTIISITQEPLAYKDAVMLTPIVRFEPFDLKLAQPVLLRMKMNQALVGENHPSIARYNYFLPDEPNGQNWDSLLSSDSIENITFSSWFSLPRLTRIFVSMPPFALEHKFQPFRENMIQNTPNAFKTSSQTQGATNFVFYYDTKDKDAFQYKPIIEYALNRGWSSYANLFKTNIPNKHYFNKIPGYVVDKFGVLPIEEPTVTNIDQPFSDNNWSIVFPPKVAGLPTTAASFVQASQHELFHVFQNTLLPASLRYPAASSIYKDHPEVGWILESSAKYMGFSITFEDYEHYQNDFQNLFGLKNKVEDFYITGLYGSVLEDGIFDLEADRSLLLSPESALLREPYYAGTHVVAAIAKKWGTQTLVDINKNYASRLDKGPKEIFDTIDSQIHLTQDLNFLDLATAYLLRDYGLGTEVTSNLDVIEGLPGSPAQKDLSPLSGYRRDKTYNENNTQEHPADFISVIDNPVSGMSISFSYLGPSSSLTAKNSINALDGSKKRLIFFY